MGNRAEQRDRKKRVRYEENDYHRERILSKPESAVNPYRQLIGGRYT
jgi:hypothetical protein